MKGCSSVFPPNAIPFSDEWFSTIEAAGEVNLASAFVYCFSRNGIHGGYMKAVCGHIGWVSSTSFHPSIVVCLLSTFNNLIYTKGDQKYTGNDTCADFVDLRIFELK